MEMKFYLNDKQITETEARKLVTDEQIAEAKQAFRDDPYEEIAYMTKAGYLVICFD